MKPESQRIAIAEACGWTEVQRSTLNPNFIVGRHPKAFDIEGRTFVPNYLSDLNSMHEAEKVLSIDQQVKFLYYLRDVTQGRQSNGCLSGADEFWFSTHSSAAQRAEAFLRTLNLWKEDEEK